MNFQTLPLVLTLLLAPISLWNCNRYEGSSELSGFVAKQVRRWPSTTIQVCWMPVEIPKPVSPKLQEGVDPQKFIDDLKTKIKDFSTSEYQKADLYLEGWDNCPDNLSETAKMLRYSLNQQAPAPSGYSESIGYTEGTNHVVLNIGNMQRESACTKSPENFQNCIASVGVHEIGHAVGLFHEMARIDNPNCNALPYEPAMEWEQGTQIGAYDEDSIMSYCFADQIESGKLTGLTEGDIKTLKLFYKGPIAEIDYRPKNFEEITARPISVGGINLSGYRFQIGNPKTMDCLDEKAYSQSIALSEPLTLKILGLESQSQGQLMQLCLLGGNEQGTWQETELYTSYILFDTNDVISNVKYETERKDSLTPSEEFRFLIRGDFPLIPQDVQLSFTYEKNPKMKFDLKASHEIKDNQILIVLPITQFGMYQTVYNGKVILNSIRIKNNIGKTFVDTLDWNTQKYQATNSDVMSFDITGGKSIPESIPAFEITQIEANVHSPGEFDVTFRIGVSNTAPAKVEYVELRSQNSNDLIKGYTINSIYGDENFNLVYASFLPNARKGETYIVNKIQYIDFLGSTIQFEANKLPREILIKF